ncbi:MAG: D-2-hydroxyacid dehydrogenase [Elainellaceae cyanobacterium]
MKIILPAAIADSLAPKLPSEVEVIWVSEAGGIDGEIADAEVYCNDPEFNREVHNQVLATAANLRWYHAASAGVNHILSDLQTRDIVLTNSAGVFADPIAETVVGYILAQAKTFFLLRSQQTQHQWAQGTDAETDMRELTDQVLLIVGAGGIGQAIARRASAFGMRVWGSRRHLRPMESFERVVGPQDWQALLPEAHYVVLTAPLTSETAGMLDRAALGKMRSDAYLINVGRGALVDEAALIETLSQRRIAGAALDTVVAEPLPQNSPLWTLENVFITPHVSGLSSRNSDRIAELFLDNLARYRQGQPLRNRVKLALGY